MLFGYPVDAIAHNWLHDCIYTILLEIHVKIEENNEPLLWPDSIPANYRDELKGYWGLKRKFVSYKDILIDLSKEERLKIKNALIDQNRISDLLSCTKDCDTLENLPEAIREIICDIFSAAFDLLTTLQIRDHHYAIIYNSTAEHVCPFCGYENFVSLSSPREALDHYLPISKYPFAGANLSNLVPMGHKCNSHYKNNVDILRKHDGVRRKSFYPYNNISVRLSLKDSVPFEGKKGIIPDWHIHFEPNIEETNTWVEIFDIRQRYTDDILNASFLEWLSEFGSWCSPRPIDPDLDEQILAEVLYYIDYWESIKIKDKAFFRVAVFQMLYDYYLQGNRRLIDVIKNVVRNAKRIPLLF